MSSAEPILRGADDVRPADMEIKEEIVDEEEARAQTGTKKKHERWDHLLDTMEVAPDHIRANGTMHSTPFAGLAELIDNAIDSQATNVKIESRPYKDAGGEEHRMLVVMDDGTGMDRKEALDTLLMGFSLKKGNVNMIGHFGNGLKSGSMRLGSSMLMVTKKTNEYTFLLLSLQYLEDIAAEKCFVPCITFKEGYNNRFERLAMSHEGTRKHENSLNVILSYSPFHTMELLWNHAKTSFPGNSGTCVTVWNLKRKSNGQYEMEFNVNECNFYIESDDANIVSLGEYLQQLYLEPQITIRIHNQMVRLVDPLRSMAECRWDFYLPGGLHNFRVSQEAQLNQQISRLGFQVGEKKREAKMLFNKIYQYSDPIVRKKLNQDYRMAQDRTQILVKQLMELREQKDNIANNKLGSELKIYMGLDLVNRSQSRAVFYSNGRRILTMDLDKKARKKMELLGVVCIVDIPHTLLPTSQNREGFETPSDVDSLMIKINKIAKLYFQYADRKYKTKEFWDALGYTEDPFGLGCDTPETYRRAVEMMGASMQCFRCLRFREINPRRETVLPIPVMGCMFKCPPQRDYPAGTLPPCMELTREERHRRNIPQLKKGTPTSYGKCDLVDDKSTIKKVVRKPEPFPFTKEQMMALGLGPTINPAPKPIKVEPQEDLVEQTDNAKSREAATAASATEKSSSRIKNKDGQAAEEGNQKKPNEDVSDDDMRREMRDSSEDESSDSDESELDSDADCKELRTKLEADAEMQRRKQREEEGESGEEMDNRSPSRSPRYERELSNDAPRPSMRSRRRADDDVDMNTEAAQPRSEIGGGDDNNYNGAPTDDESSPVRSGRGAKKRRFGGARRSDLGVGLVSGSSNSWLHVPSPQDSDTDDLMAMMREKRKEKRGRSAESDGDSAASAAGSRSRSQTPPHETRRVTRRSSQRLAEKGKEEEEKKKDKKKYRKVSMTQRESNELQKILRKCAGSKKGPKTSHVTREAMEGMSTAQLDALMEQMKKERREDGCEGKGWESMQKEVDKLTDEKKDIQENMRQLFGKIIKFNALPAGSVERKNNIIRTHIHCIAYAGDPIKKLADTIKEYERRVEESADSTTEDRARSSSQDD